MAAYILKVAREVLGVIKGNKYEATRVDTPIEAQETWGSTKRPRRTQGRLTVKQGCEPLKWKKFRKLRSYSKITFLFIDWSAIPELDDSFDHTNKGSCGGSKSMRLRMP
jgi:hypothetical protein